MPGPAYYSGVMSIAKNEDWIVPFIYGTVDEADVFTPIDLTGSTLKLEIRKTEADHEVFVKVETDDGIRVDDAAAGAFTVFIERDRLVRLAPGAYVSDLVREMPTGYQERIWEGVANVVEGTTRP